MTIKWFYVAAVAILCLAAGVAVWSLNGEAPAQSGPGMHCGGGGGWMAEQLTPEQRQGLKAKIMEMKDEGASPEEIHAAVKQMLAGWGVELPQAGGGQGGRMGSLAKQEGAGAHHRGGGGWMAEQLTPEQRQELKAKIMEMKDQGASQAEIHAAVKQMLAEYGVEIPQGCHGNSGEE